MAEECASWTDTDGDRQPCRFGDDVPRTDFGGKIYCDYHLPMGEPGEGGKADWDKTKMIQISEAIRDRIRAEIAKPEEQRGKLNFQSVVVPEALTLRKETMWLIDMRGAQFYGPVEFVGGPFYGDAWFSDAVFHRNVNFDDSTFLDDAEFNRTHFRGGATFRNSVFRGGALFNNAQFKGVSEFVTAQFHCDAEFEEAEFDSAQFTKAHFREDAQFRKARFFDLTGFDSAEFHKEGWFNEVEFHKTGRFREAVFRGRLNFTKAQFHGVANFYGAVEPEAPARTFKVISFLGAHFGGAAIFSNRTFLDHTVFSGCQFSRAPNFHGSILHQDTAFGGIKCFPDTTSPGADRAYRTLRQAMEGHRARAEEGMFYTLEQKARRHGMRRFDPAFVISLCYGLGSNYGFSVVRPLVSLVGGIIASTGLLIAVGMVFGGPDGSGADLAAMWKDGLLFSVRQLFLPFDALRSKDAILAAYAFNPGGTGWLRAWGVVLTLFEAVAALLLVLAVRWRYRR